MEENIPQKTLDEITVEVGKPYLVPVGVLQLIVFACLILSPALLFWITLLLYLKVLGTLVFVLIGVAIVYQTLKKITKQLVIDEIQKEAKRRANEKK